MYVYMHYSMIIPAHMFLEFKCCRFIFTFLYGKVVIFIHLRGESELYLFFLPFGRRLEALVERLVTFMTELVLFLEINVTVFLCFR